MTSHPTLAARLTALLGLAHPPVAVRFEHGAGHARDDGVDSVEPVAAGCCFWAPAETARLVTRAADHAGCSIGGHVLGLRSAEEVAGSDDVRALASTGWVSPADLATLPTLDRAPARIVYEPLANAAEPDVVLLRLTPGVLVRLQGALTELDLVGKPQCQILARAAAGRAAVSPGCTVSRARTGLPAEELTVALPGGGIEDLVRRLEDSAAADDAVVAYA